MLAAPLEVHETNWKCLHSSASLLPDTLRKYFSSTKFSLNSCSQSGKTGEKTLYFFRFLIFIFGFRFLWIHATGLPEALHSYTNFFLILEFPHRSDTESLLADVDSCDEDGDEADERRDEMWFLTAFPALRVPMFIAEFPQ